MKQTEIEKFLANTKVYVAGKSKEIQEKLFSLGYSWNDEPHKMTREEKDLLLKDLCTRLPYEVKVQYEDGIFTIDYISGIYGEIKLNTPDRYTIDVSEVKPYLFPLSSMTEEQKKYINNRWSINEDFYLEIDPNLGKYSVYFVDLCDVVDYINWLNENHFDYRGLIEKGLAIDCINLDIY